MPFDAKTGVHDFAPLISLELLFRTEMDFVMNTARRCGLSDADAEDVTQQVFIALQRRLHTLHAPESVRPWLMTVTRRHARARMGASHRTEEGLPDRLGEIEDDVPLAEELLTKSERRHEMLDLLEEIEPREVRLRGVRGALREHVQERGADRGLALRHVADRVVIDAPELARRADDRRRP